MALAMALRACAPLADLGLGGARGEGGAETWSQSPSSLQSCTLVHMRGVCVEYCMLWPACNLHVEARLKAERKIVRGEGSGRGLHTRTTRSCAHSHRARVMIGHGC